MLDEHIFVVISLKMGLALKFVGFTPALIARLPTGCCGTLRMANPSAVRLDLVKYRLLPVIYDCPVVLPRERP